MTNWPIPEYDPQSSTSSESDSCQTQATLHCIEMLLGNVQRFSVRATATLAGINPNAGGTIQQVLVAINKYGLIPYDLWPDLSDPWTDPQFYAPIPQAVLAQANKSYIVTTASPDLNLSPLLVEIQVSPTMTHLVAQFNATEVFDSYQPAIKPLSTWVPSAIVGKWGLTIKPKKPMYCFQVAGNQTIFVPVGSSLVPLADMQAMTNLGLTAANIVPVTQDWLNSQNVVYNDLFKSNS